jgi:D-beta-D-heptose 7-phosphate kinase / D-beta-D-heptose 1-phosphate adenosyltransferase
MIAVIGDIMLDKYIYGSSVRMSPEYASAPVIKEYATKEYIGGAGNTALNIKNLNCAVMLFCALHKDSELKRILDREELLYYATPNYCSDVLKTRIFSNGQYIARLDYDFEIDCSEEHLADELFASKPNLIVISDYNKGTLSNPSNIISKATSLGIKCLVDPKKSLDEYKGAFLLKPNLKEFSEWLDLDTSLPEDELINKLSKTLLEDAVNRLKIDNLLVTLGQHGSILATSTGLIKKIDALPIKAVDVTGAGDSFLAGVAVALYEKNNITKAIHFASKVAGIAVTKKGTSYVKRNEI